VRSAGMSLELYLTDADPEAIERSLAAAGERTEGGAIRLPWARALATRWPKAVMVSLPVGSPDEEAMQLFTALQRAAQAGGFSLRTSSPAGPLAGPQDLLAALQAARGQHLAAANGPTGFQSSPGGAVPSSSWGGSGQRLFALAAFTFAALCFHSYWAAHQAALRSEPYHDWVFDLWDGVSRGGMSPLIAGGVLASLWCLGRTAVILFRRQYLKAAFWVPLALASVAFLWWASTMLYGVSLLRPE
jgi:hypothetical protein